MAYNNYPQAVPPQTGYDDAYPKQTAQPPYQPTSDSASPQPQAVGFGPLPKVAFIVCAIVAAGGAVLGLLLSERKSDLWFVVLPNVVIAVLLLLESGEDRANGSIVKSTAALGMSLLTPGLAMKYAAFHGDDTLPTLGLILNGLAALLPWAFLNPSALLPKLRAGFKREWRPIVALIAMAMNALGFVLMITGEVYDTSITTLVNIFWMFCCFFWPLRFTYKLCCFFWFSCYQSSLMGVSGQGSNIQGANFGATIAWIGLWVFVFAEVSRLKGMRTENFKRGSTYRTPVVMGILVCTFITAVGAVLKNCGLGCFMAILCVLIMFFAVCVEGEVRLAFLVLAAAMLFGTTPFLMYGLADGATTGSTAAGAIIMIIAMWVALLLALLAFYRIAPLPTLEEVSMGTQQSTLPPPQLDLQCGAHVKDLIAAALCLVGAVLWWIDIMNTKTFLKAEYAMLALMDFALFTMCAFLQPAYSRVVLWLAAYNILKLGEQLCLMIGDQTFPSNTTLSVIGCALTVLAHLVWIYSAGQATSAHGEPDPNTNMPSSTLPSSSTPATSYAPTYDIKPVGVPPQQYGAQQYGYTGYDAKPAPAAGPAPGGYFNATAPAAGYPATAYPQPAPGGYFNAAPPRPGYGQT